MSDLEPLPQDLHQLFADERSAYADDDAARARVMRRLETAVVFAGVAAGIAGAGVAGLAAAGANSSASWLAAKKVWLWLGMSLVTGVAIGETHARLASAPASTAPANAAVPAVAPPTTAAPSGPARTPSDR